MHDLASKHPDRVKSLASAWQTWAEENHVLPLVPQAKANATESP